jgi:hypothetical protein
VLVVDADMLPLNAAYWQQLAADAVARGGVIANADAYNPTPQSLFGPQRFPLHGFGLQVSLWRSLFPYSSVSASSPPTTVLSQLTQALHTLPHGGGWASDEDLLQRTLHSLGTERNVYPHRLVLHCRKTTNTAPDKASQRGSCHASTQWQAVRRLETCDLSTIRSLSSASASASQVAAIAVEEHFKQRPAWSDSAWLCLQHIIRGLKLLDGKQWEWVQQYRVEFTQAISQT